MNEDMLIANSKHLTVAVNGYQVHIGPYPPKGALGREELEGLDPDTLAVLGLYDKKGNSLSKLPFYYLSDAEREGFLKAARGSVAE